ncbi:MAG: signal recognition particle protein Srp19 [Thermoprotei archaeon]|nr:MAG: signal recognition particle protein Srp19 [Thermoprotei archaeon]
MKRAERRFVVLWPIYFDRGKSRSEGRKVAKSLAIERPSLKDLEEAVKSLKYEYLIEEDKKHPASWFEHQGRLLVYTEEKKSKVIKKIAEKLVLLRK